jgi:hypothetical protein
MIGAEHLAKKDPEGHDGSENSILPTGTDGFLCLFENISGQDLSEWEVAFLKKLMSEKLELLTKPTLV